MGLACVALDGSVAAIICMSLQIKPSITLIYFSILTWNLVTETYLDLYKMIAFIHSIAHPFMLYLYRQIALLCFGWAWSKYAV